MRWMRDIRVAANALLAVMCVFGSGLAAQQTPKTDRVTLGDLRGTSKTKPFILDLDWKENVSPRTVRVTRRLTANQPFTIHVTHFNFVRYALNANVKDTVIASYQALDKLWGSVLGGLTGLVPPAAASRSTSGETRALANDHPFLIKFRAWRAAIDSQAELFGKRVKAVPSDAIISDPVLGDLKAGVSASEAALAKLDTARAASYELIVIPSVDSPELTYYAQQLYSDELVRHNALAERLRGFIAGAQATIDGRDIVIGTKPAGTLSTVTLTVSSLTGEPADAATAGREGATTIEYLVSSGHPVVFHAGVAYSSVSDLRTEKVRAPSDQDLFRQIRNPDASTDLTAFLSYALFDIDAIDRGVLLTLGTDLRKPGEKLYAGASFQLTRRLLLTGGAVSREVSQGKNLVQGDLFETIRDVRKWGWFVSATASPF